MSRLTVRAFLTGISWPAAGRAGQSRHIWQSRESVTKILPLTEAVLCEVSDSDGDSARHVSLVGCGGVVCGSGESCVLQVNV